MIGPLGYQEIKKDVVSQTAQAVHQFYYEPSNQDERKETILQLTSHICN
jgi:hypothetical protein